MNKTLKISLIVLMICIAMAGLAAGYAVSFINPTQLTKILSSSVQDATGRELAITGPVSLHVFPSISVKAEQIALSNVSWASNPNMLTLKKLDLDIKFWPLLKGSVEISRIGLAGLEVNLETNKSGEGNWNLATSSAATNNSASQGAGVNSNNGTFISFKDIDILDASIHFREGKQAAKTVKIPKLSFDNEEEKSGILMDLQFDNQALNLKGKTSSLLNAYSAWDQSPVNIDLDLVLTLSGKSLAIAGKIDKQPKILPQFNVTLNSKSFDLVPLVGAAVVSTGSTKVVSATSSKTSEKYFFSDERLPFGLLPVSNGSVDINIATLGIPGQAPFTNFKTVLQFNRNKIDANSLSFNVGKGSAETQISIVEFDGLNPKILTKGFARGFNLEQIISSANASGKVTGGETHIAWNLQGTGLSLHQILSRASGLMQFSVGQGTINSQFINQGGDFLVTVAEAINPLYQKSSQTVLDCAIAYLPVNKGLVTIQDSVGIETDRLDITLSGSINLASEALDINISPKEKSGLATGLDLAGLVNIGGLYKIPRQE